MAKFKVGDEVAIAALVKITAIQPTVTGKVSYSTDRGFCIHETLMDEIALAPKDPKTEEPKPAPHPAHRFKVGDRVDTGFYGLGTVIFVDVEPDAENKPSYLVRGEKKWDREAWIGCVTDNKITSGKGCDWFNCYQLSPAPAPEPPKFYTGKVVCVEWKGDTFRHTSAGRIAVVTNGISDYNGWNRVSKPFESFSDFCSANTHGVFYEIKE